MSGNWTCEVPWSTIKPNAQTIIDYHIAKYAGRVSFESVTDIAWPIGCILSVTAGVTTGVRRRSQLCTC